MLYLIRHAQAGPRGNYDELSSLGIRQAEMLGRYFHDMGLRFDAFITGGMQRQQQTAEIVNSRLAAPVERVTDLRWNEIKLGEIYRGISARLCLGDEQFALDFGEMKRMLSDDPYGISGAIARCDRTVMSSWIEGRFPDEGHETWSAFQSRVREGLFELRASQPGNVAVFTSATPIVVATGAMLNQDDGQMLENLWCMYNVGITLVASTTSPRALESFNATPHLTDETMRTRR